MSNTKSSTVVCSGYASLPILMEENFANWEMQIVAYLTGAQDHIHVITPVKQANNTYKDPAPPALLIQLPLLMRRRQPTWRSPTGRSQNTLLLDA